MLQIIRMSTIRKIKADAQVSVTLGTPFIARLQQAMIYIAQDLTEEQLTTLKEKMSAGIRDFDEPIIQHTATLFMLIADVERTVVDNNLYVDEPADEANPLGN